MKTLLEVKNISKSFNRIKVLEDVSLSFNRGEVVALSGENGAGKSTLMKIISGLYPPDEGTVIFNNTEYETFDLLYSRKLGVSLIHQELSIAPNVTVMENIFMGNELFRYGILNKKLMYKKANETLKQLNTDLNLRVPAGHFSVAQQQQIEIARAISHKSELIIMDEPTASLSKKEIYNLFNLIRKLQEQNITIVYISHKMDEIKEIADRVQVLRDGKYIGESSVDDINKTIYMMVGRSLDSFYDNEEKVKVSEKESEANTLELKNLSDMAGCIHNVSCQLHSGMIIGLFGLVGAGRSELARLIFGADKISEGDISLNGKLLKIKKPIDAIKHGIGMVPEDRKLQGLFLDMTTLENLVANNQLDNAYLHMILNNSYNKSMAEQSIEALNIKTTLEKEPRYLSGGNQQKILLSRWLNISLKVIILDEPTRGIDVGAKQEIYRMIRKIANKGVIVILISSELPEIINLSNRILVMKEGYLVGDLAETDNLTQEKIMHLCT